jgi:hypothetical protein
MQVLFGLQPQAKQINEMEVFEQVTGLRPEMRGTPEYRKAYFDFKRQGKEAITINTGGGDKAANYEVKQDDQGNYIRINKLTGTVEPLGVKGSAGGQKPATRADKARAEQFQSGITKDYRNYELTQDEIDTAIQTGRISVEGKRLKPEALSRINAMREEAQLPPLVETPKTMKTSRAIGGFSIPGTGGEETEYRYPTGQGQGPAPAQPQAQAMPSMPPASQAAGRTIKDTVTGKRYKSNGNKWVEIK